MFTRVLLYQLKRLYGTTADVTYESADAVDLATGVRTVTKQAWWVRRAISLPTATSAMAMLPPALEPIWKQGGGAEIGDKVVIIDRRDLPKSLRIETHNWSLAIEHRRYEVLRVEEFGDAYLITVKELAGARVYAQVAECVTQGVTVGP